MGHEQGGGPGAVVKAACLENRRSRVRPPAGIQVIKKQNVTSSLSCKDLILWDREKACSAPEFRIRCLEGSVTLFISPSSGGSPGPVRHTCAHIWPKPPPPSSSCFLGHEQTRKWIFS